MAWEVDDLEEAIAELRERGVIFEEYDVPGLKTVNGIAEVEGNYHSKGVPVVLTKDPTDMHLSCADVGAAVGW